MANNGIFSVKEIQSWDDIHQYKKWGWIFRGQTASLLPLETSLERACKNFERPVKEARKIEDQLLREFQRKYHHYAVHIPKTKNSLEWFSLMQHYGAPTRLLDFTYSIYVAAYFALENAEGQCAVWAINMKWAAEESAALFEEGSKEWKFIKDDITEKNEEDFNDTFMSSAPKTFACPMNPFRLNERLAIQKGVFMCPGDVCLEFENNLKALPRWSEDQNIFKILIPKNLRRASLDWLADMNISRATLFPGLQGFAQSLTVSLPLKWD
jgi:hypothetical protein